MSAIVDTFTGRKQQKEEIKAADRASQMQQQQFEASRADLNRRQDEWIAQANALSQGYQPAVEAGRRASDLQAALSGALGREAQIRAYQDYQDSPSVAFQREQGMRGLEQGLNSAGIGGGTRLKELSRFNQGLAAQEFNNYYNRLGSQSQQGSNALNNLIAARTSALAGGVNTAGNIGSLGSQYVDNLGNLELGKASSYANRFTKLGETGKDVAANLLGMPR